MLNVRAGVEEDEIETGGQLFHPDHRSEKKKKEI